MTFGTSLTLMQYPKNTCPSFSFPRSLSLPKKTDLSKHSHPSSQISPKKMAANLLTVRCLLSDGVFTFLNVEVGYTDVG